MKEVIDNYQRLRSELFNYENKISKIVRLYFEQKLKDGDWQHYSGWSLSGDTLVISYSYTDYYHNAEFVHIVVDLSEFLEFSKTI